MPLASRIIVVLKGRWRSDSELSVRVAAEAALNQFYGVEEDLTSIPDNIEPIKLEDELTENR